MVVGTRVSCLSGLAMAKDDDRLNSWKEIASALNREVRTVQMWEKQEGLPIHRHFHSRRSTVFAFRTEIQSWAQQRTQIRALAAAPKFAPLRHWLHTVLASQRPAANSGSAEAREAYFKGRYFWNRRN